MKILLLGLVCRGKIACGKVIDMYMCCSLQSRLSAASSTPVVAMSNATATGGFADALIELDKHKDTGHTREQTKAIEKCLEQDKEDGELKER